MLWNLSLFLGGGDSKQHFIVLNMAAHLENVYD